MKRYEKNGILSDAQMDVLRKSHVCIIGCGGLGGYILEMLARIGVGEMTVVDGDRFDETNLNRQLLSEMSNISKYKVDEARLRAARINPETEVHPIRCFLDEQNVTEIVQNKDVVVDGLDKIAIRKVLQNACEKAMIPMIHGAIAGWYGQVTTIFPGERTLDRMYPSDQDRGVETEIGNPSFTPALVASLEVSEVIKVLTNQGNCLRNKMLYVDLLENEFDLLDI